MRLNTFDTKKEALADEYKWQCKLKVKTAPLFINQAVAAPNGFFGRDNSGKNHPQYGTNLTAEHKNKISKARLKNGSGVGSKNPMYGRNHTDEVKERLRQVNIGRKRSAESIAKQKKNAKGVKHNHVDKTCPHCGLTGKAPNMTRYHFDNCRQKNTPIAEGILIWD